MLQTCWRGAATIGPLSISTVIVRLLSSPTGKGGDGLLDEPLSYFAHGCAARGAGDLLTPRLSLTGGRLSSGAIRIMGITVDLHGIAAKLHRAIEQPEVVVAITMDDLDVGQSQGNTLYRSL